MANESPAFQFYPRDFVADPAVSSMTAEQVGAYILILCAAWQSDRPGYLENDPDLLAGIAKLDSERWARCSKAIMRALKVTEDGAWVYSKRMVQEREKQVAFRAQASEAGKRSAEARAQRKVNAPSTTVERPLNGPSTDLERTLNGPSNETPTEGQRNVNSASASASADPDKQTHARARVDEIPQDEVDAAATELLALWMAWRKAGLPQMVPPRDMQTLCDRLSAAIHPPEFPDWCAAFKKLTDGWRAGNAPSCGATPQLMLEHLDKVELVMKGQLDPFAKPANAARPPPKQEESRPKPPSFRKKAANGDE